MKYEHVLSYVANTPWAILPEKLSEIVSVLAYRAAGQHFSDEEIKARIGDPQPPVARRQGTGIAVIPLRGVIAHRMGGMDESSGGMSAERFSSMLRAVMAEEQVGTVVIDVDSPGGTIPGVQEAAAELFEARGKGTKRIVAVANSTMASAAYWIASQADEIVAIPSSVSIGSIGVFLAREDVSEALEKQGVKVHLISAGKHKVDNLPFQAMSEDTREHLQGLVDGVYAQFVKDVARGRGVSVQDVKNGYGQGRALNAKDAKAAGLVDRIATMDETLSGLVIGRSAAGLRAEEGLDLAAEDDRTGIIEIHEHANRDILDALAARGDEDRARRLRVL